MAVIVLSRPGTGYGPCLADACAHRDCAWARQTAAKPCTHCGQPIGYDRRFLEHDGGVVHADCLETTLAPTRITRH